MSDKRLARAARAWQLRAAFKKESEIAAELGVSISTVSRLLTSTAALVSAQMKANIDQIRAQQVERHEFIAIEAIGAWEKSKQAKGTVTRKSGRAKASKDGDEAVSAEETTTRAENQTGDPRYLTVAMAALDAQRKLQGLDAPMKVANTDPEGNDKPNAPPPDTADTVARTAVRIAALLDAARARRDAAAAGASGDGTGSESSAAESGSAA